MDPGGEFAYFGISFTPFQQSGQSRVIKVNLDGFDSYQTLTLNTGGNSISAAAIDPAGIFGYFGINSSPGRVVKVHLPTLQSVATIQVDTRVSA